MAKRIDDDDAANSRQVYIDFEFSRIGEIDTMNDKYYAEVFIQISWVENSVIEEYDRKKHWNPQIFFENTVAKPDEIIEFSTICKEHKTLITEKRRIKGHFWERLEIHNFPMDCQELSVVLASKIRSKNLKLVGRNYKFGKNAMRTFMDQQKWRLMNLVECKTDSLVDTNGTVEAIAYPVLNEDLPLNVEARIRFNTYAVRRPWYYYANAFLLIFLITTVSLSTFSIDCKLPQNRIPSTATFLLTSISFKWAVNRSLPPVSYTTSLDLYSVVCICFLCLECMWHAIIGAFWTKPAAIDIDKWLLLTFSLIHILIHALFGVKAFKGYRIIRQVESKMYDYLADLEKSTKKKTSK